MSVDGIAATAARAVPRGRDPEPDRVRGHVPVARGAARPLHRQARRRATRRSPTKAAMLRLAHRGVAPATLADVQAVVTPDELLGLRDVVDATDGRRPDRRLRGRARAPDARAPERRARCEPAGRGAPARGGEGRGPARGSRVRDPRRRRRGRARGAAPPASRCAPKPSSSTTAPTTPSPPRSRRCPFRDDTDAARRVRAARGRADRARRFPASVSLASRRGRRDRDDRRRRARAPSRCACVRTVPRTLSRAASRRRCASRPTPRPRTASRSARPNPPTSRSNRRSVGGDARRAVDRAPAGRGGAAAGYRPAAEVRSGLGRCTFSPAKATKRTLLVYPDVAAAQRLVVALRRGQFRDPGLRARGPLGLGTDFESIRDYLPDDDVRQINWTATERVGRPMSNVYRIEQDRDVVCLLDAGRLMAAPLDVAHHPARRRGRRGRRWSRSSPTSSATAAGSPCSTASCAPQLRPRRNGGRAVVRAILDAEPTAGRQRLRPRVPHGERRQAFADPRLHRSRRRSRGPVTRRRRCRC